MTQPEDPNALGSVAPGASPWRLCVADTVTGQVIYNLAMPSAPTFSQPFNGAGQLNISIIMAGEARPPDTIVTRLRQKQRNMLALAYGNKVLQVAVVNQSTTDDTQSPPIMTFQVDTFWDFFTKYRVIRTPGADPLLTTSDVIFGPSSPDPAHQALSLGGVAIRLAYFAMGANFDSRYRLPVNLPDLSNYVGSAVLSYASADRQKTGEAWGDLVATAPGPEIALTPRWSDDTHSFIVIDMRVSQDGGHLGQLGFPHAWDYHSACTIFQTVDDGTALAMVVYETGQDNRADGGTGTLTATFVDDFSLCDDLGFPVLEAVDTNHSTETSVANLAAYGNAILKAGDVETGTMTIRLDGCNADGVKVSPAIDEIDEGDTGVITFTDQDPHPELGVGDWALRIMAIGMGQDLFTAQLTVQILGQVQH